MFEAIHGSAPRRAGQNLANPTGLLLGAVMMLVHVGLTEHAERVHNAWLRTIEDGIHTYDVYDEKVSKQKVGTKEFAEAVVARLGQTPQILKTRKYSKGEQSHASATSSKPAQKELVGVDVFLDWTSGSANDLGDALSKVNGEGVKLTMISNRGVKVWPGGHTETFCSDHWRCRFLPESEGGKVVHAQVVSLLSRIAGAGYDFIKTEGLYTFDGQRGFSLDQGE
jgi:isocitrate dehydrogenase